MLNVDLFIVAPIFFLVLIGFVSRKTGFMDKAFGKKMLDFTLFVPLAATAFLAISKLRLSGNDILLPTSSFVFVGVLYVLSRILGKQLRLPRVQDAVFRISLLILNTGFVLIFAIPMLGPEGVQKVFLIELGSIPVIFSLIYLIAAENSPKAQNHPLGMKGLLKKVFTLPPFLASIAGLAFVLMQLNVPDALVTVLTPLSATTFPLLAISTGIFLEPSFSHKKVIATSVIAKMGFGFVLGWVYCSLFAIDGLSRAVLLAAFSSPVGFNTVAYSARENLDVELAASLFFTSALIGLFTVPAIFVLFS